MEFRIRIVCDNEPFGASAHDVASEVLTIIDDQVREIVKTAGCPLGLLRPLRDSHGNHVGSIEVLVPEDDPHPIVQPVLC